VTTLRFRESAAERIAVRLTVLDGTHSPPAFYDPARLTFAREQVGTPCRLMGVRTLVDPGDPADMAKVHVLQDAINVEQKRWGTCAVPALDH